ncbi:hypothetical protein ATCV1_z701L [Acanthocystis turfacea chlorella virus 1]|uniref:Uncharacterized protein z701L n=1 Tax=Chlorovirus heliozoae TaxID=322019 RepID=A7K9W1_9PHYC|nr:hypothetical protein ATCV1_z701L [Acanthocystis turfacea chlorella virus 1]ABT16835.1 hypothetical protein ATCV1_z701L [Acanthocystis turfacea chlorella virus 1]
MMEMTTPMTIVSHAPWGTFRAVLAKNRVVRVPNTIPYTIENRMLLSISTSTKETRTYVIIITPETEKPYADAIFALSPKISTTATQPTNAAAFTAGM